MIPLPRMGLFRTQLADVRVQAGPRSYVGITIPLKASFEVAIAGRQTEIWPGSAHVLDPDELFDLRTGAKSGGMVVANFDRGLVETITRQLDPAGREFRGLRSQLDLAEPNATVFYRQLVRTWKECARGWGRGRARLSEDEAQLSLVEAFVQAADPTGRLRGNAGYVTSEAVRRAEEYVRDNFTESLGLGALAEVVGVHAASLCRAFRRRYGIGPMRYVRRIRLQAAHRTLLSTEPSTHAVSRTALSLGFTHMSRFSQYYREEFGELPSETLAS